MCRESFYARQSSQHRQSCCAVYRTAALPVLAGLADIERVMTHSTSTKILQRTFLSRHSFPARKSQAVYRIFGLQNPAALLCLCWLKNQTMPSCLERVVRISFTGNFSLCASNYCIYWSKLSLPEVSSKLPFGEGFGKKHQNFKWRQSTLYEYCTTLCLVMSAHVEMFRVAKSPIPSDWLRAGLVNYSDCPRSTQL